FRSIHKNFPGFRYFACGGARLDPEIFKKLSLLGFKVLEAYGLTETAPIATINNFAKPIPGSVGKAAREVSLKIEKDDPRLEYGEICIKGPNVMMGYYKRPDLTEQAVIDGWFHSGDLGFLDDKKNLYITGRKKEVLVLPNGKNIYPEELETVYKQSEKIKELCITLLNEGERTLLTIVIYPNREYFVRKKSTNVYQDIKFEIENIGQKLPPYQRVSKIELVDEELPKTSLGKIKRYKVTELLKNRIAVSPTGTGMISPEGLDPFLIFVKDVLKLEYLPHIKNNLETDLGLDSLSKLEFLALVEKKYNIRIEEDQAAGFFTLEDIKRVIPATTQEEHVPDDKLLADELLTSPELPLEKHVSVGNNPLSVTARFCFHILCKLFFKLFFRARLEGRENLKGLNPPFI
ncbi:MAG: AMP-binding protein, partial [Thermodesulfobacteriota bacterium]|nr:AMP-binding protein [Thermodesulfobacteriota bacterium]